MADGTLILDRAQLAATKDALVRAHLKVGKSSVGEVTREFELKLERATERAGGGKLARAFKSEVRPKGTRIAREPAGFIFVNGGARTRGAITFIGGKGSIRGKGGGLTAIPLPAAGKRGRDRNLTPEKWEQRTGRKLRLVVRRGKPPLLVADMGRIAARFGTFQPIKRDRTKLESKRGFVTGEVSVPIFVLLPEYSFRGRFSIAGVMNGADTSLARSFADKAATIGKVD